MAIKYLKTAKLKNKTVLMRVDVNVPLDENGRVADDFRIREMMPTLHLLFQQQCKVILCGHLGRPGGKRKAELSLRPVAEYLANMLGIKFVQTQGRFPDYQVRHLVFADGDIRKTPVRKAIMDSPATNVIFLENLRFYPEEEQNDTFFAKQLASVADVYINEAFSVDHHPAASLVPVTKYLTGYGGLVLQKEVIALDAILHHARPPFVVMMGGIKISEKERVLLRLGKKADHLLLTGGIANAFFLSKGFEIGKSAVEEGSSKLAWQLAHNFKDKVVLPEDVVVANEKLSRASIRVCTPYQVKPSELILDIGPKTILRFAKLLKPAKTIVWNGPLGRFEVKPFHHGTLALARVIGGVSKGKAFSVVGGGETVDAVHKAGQEKYIDHVSTGGGAMLSYLAGDKLPGIEALK